jgi:hypothetical protein
MRLHRFTTAIFHRWLNSRRIGLQQRQERYIAGDRSLGKNLMEKLTNAVSRVSVQFELAGLYLDKQQPLEAKHIYEQIQKENPATETAALAQSKAAAIK